MTPTRDVDIWSILPSGSEPSDILPSQYVERRPNAYSTRTLGTTQVSALSSLQRLYNAYPVTTHQATIHRREDNAYLDTWKAAGPSLRSRDRVCTTEPMRHKIWRNVLRLQVLALGRML